MYMGQILYPSIQTAFMNVSQGLKSKPHTIDNVFDLVATMVLVTGRHLGDTWKQPF